MKNIVIVGSGGFAKEVVFLIEDINRISKEWNILGFINSNLKEKAGKYNVVENDEWLENIDNELHVAFGVGVPSLIEKLFKRFSVNTNIKFPNLIHPNVVGDWEQIKLGRGNIICASNTLTTDIEIGNCNIINLDSTIGHDCKIGDYNVINPSCNISGGVVIKNSILIGTNSTILQYINICSNVIVGAASLVTKNIEKEGVYIGSPIKRMIK